MLSQAPTKPSGFEGRWVAQRECFACDFSGPETEFLGAGLDLDGNFMAMHRDDRPDGAVLVCVGCVASWGRVEGQMLRTLLINLVERGLSE